MTVLASTQVRAATDGERGRSVTWLGRVTVVLAGLAIAVVAGLTIGAVPALAEEGAEETSEQSAPAAPQNLSGRGLHVGMVHLDWDYVADANSYEVEFWDRQYTWLSLPDDESGIAATFLGSSALLNGLPDGGLWEFRVRAVNDAGVSGYSDTLMIQSTYAGNYQDLPRPWFPGTPAAPTGLLASEELLDRIELYWKAPSDVGDSEITGYRIEGRRIDRDSFWSLIGQTGADVLTFIHRDELRVRPHWTWQYRISAINAVGRGQDSELVEGSTAHPPPAAPVVYRAPVHDVAADWALLPAGEWQPGDRFRLMFITSTGRNVYSHQIEDYNQFVQQAAARGHEAIRPYSADFRVVGSTRTVDARDNTDTVYPTAEGNRGYSVYWLQGSKIAGSYKYFYWDSWHDPRFWYGPRFEWQGNQWVNVRPWRFDATRGEYIYTDEYGVSMERRMCNGWSIGSYPLNPDPLPCIATGSEQDGTVYSGMELGSSDYVRIGKPTRVLPWESGNMRPIIGESGPLDFRPRASGPYITELPFQNEDGEWDVQWVDIATPDRISRNFFFYAMSPIFRVEGGCDYVWCATASVTPASNDQAAVGWDADGGHPQATLSPTTFTYAEVEYTVAALVGVADATDVEINPLEQSQPATGTLTLKLSPLPTAEDMGLLLLRVGRETLRFKDAVRDSAAGTFVWSGLEGFSDDLTPLVDGAQVKLTILVGAVPGTPQHLQTESGGADAIELSWEAPTDPGGGALTAYQVYRSRDRGLTWSVLERGIEPSETSWTHGGLGRGERYIYRVSAFNAAGEGEPSGSAFGFTEPASVPGRPRNISWTNDGLSPIIISWDEPLEDGGAAITHYKVETSVGESDGWNWDHRDDLDFQLETMHFDHDSDPAVERYYRVSAVNAVGAGPPTLILFGASAVTAPGAPQNLSWTPTDAGVKLCWEAPEDDGGSSVTGYRVEGSSDGRSWTELESSTTTLCYTDEDAVPGLVYFYRVTALNVLSVAFHSGFEPAEFALMKMSGDIPLPSADGVSEGDDSEADVDSCAAVWCAMLTVALRQDASEIWGYLPNESYAGSSLEPAQFSRDGVEYQVEGMVNYGSRSTLALRLRPMPAVGAFDDLILQLGSLRLPFKSAIRHEARAGEHYLWTNPGLLNTRGTPLVAGASIELKLGAPDAEQLSADEQVYARAAQPLTGAFVAGSGPAGHGGAGQVFTIRVQFSEPLAVSYKVLRDQALEVDGGAGRKFKRVDGSNSLWEIHVAPTSAQPVTLTLPTTTDCGAADAVCTAQGKPLSAALTVTIPGPTPTPDAPNGLEGASAPSPNSEAAGKPTISGTAQVGETLTAATTGIEDDDGLDAVVYSFQWLAGGTPIPGATASSYTLTQDEQGQTIEVRVSFADDAGNEETLTSDPTDAVAARPNRLPTGKPTISGTAQVGETLTASTAGIEDDDGLDNASYSYQWLAGGEPIEEATADSYTLTSGQQGQTIELRVSFTDDRGHEETLTSDPTDPVAAATPASNSLPTGKPTISGTVQVGETLTAVTSAIEDDDGLPESFTYQWFTTDAGGVSTRVKASHSLATYRLRPADKGKTVTVRINYTDGGGTVESVVSDPTAAVSGVERTERPHDLTATVVDGAVVLSWTDAVNGPDYNAYQILRRRPEQGESELLVYVNRHESADPTYTDTEVEPGVLYVYRVQAVVTFFGELGEASGPAEVRVPAGADGTDADDPAEEQTNSAP